MKSKVLLMPSIILVVIIFTIGIILPKIFETKTFYVALKDAKKELDSTMQKVEKANELSQTLIANTEKQNILTRYIPLKEQEEDAINNLDMLAYTEGLALTKLSPAPKNEILALQDASDNLIKISGINMAVVGNYGKIKTLLEKIKGMQRFNKILSLKISKVIIPNQDNANSDQLQADMVLGFGYLNKVTVVNVNSDILNSGKFNMSVVDKITNNAKTNFSEITPGQAGKTNPFIP